MAEFFKRHLKFYSILFLLGLFLLVTLFYIACSVHAYVLVAVYGIIVGAYFWHGIKFYIKLAHRHVK